MTGSSFFTRLWAVRPDHVDSMAAYSRYLKVDVRLLFRWRAQTISPLKSTVERLAKKLNVDPAWLLFGAPDDRFKPTDRR